jgi:hypothetical protein
MRCTMPVQLRSAPFLWQRFFYVRGGLSPELVTLEGLHRVCFDFFFN